MIDQLFFGDNLDALSDRIASESGNLIYSGPARARHGAREGIDGRVRQGPKSGTALQRDAAAAGRFEDKWGWTYPKLQTITLAAPFQGKKPQIPPPIHCA